MQACNTFDKSCFSRDEVHPMRFPCKMILHVAYYYTTPPLHNHLYRLDFLLLTSPLPLPLPFATVLPFPSLTVGTTCTP